MRFTKSYISCFLIVLLLIILRSHSFAAPPKPTGVYASDGVYMDSIHITSFFVSGATSHKIYRSTSSKKVGNLVATTTMGAWKDCGVELGKKFYYRVKACDSSGCSNYSSPNSGFAKLMIPSPLTTIRASNGSFPDKIHVYYSKPRCATPRQGTYFEIYRSTSSNSYGSLVQTKTGSFWDDTSVTSGTTYYYRVKECNSKGCSTISKLDHGFAKIAVPEIPSSIDAGNGVYTDKICITGYTVTGATRYEIYRSTSSHADGDRVRTTHNPAWYDYSIAAGTVYYYKVKACNTSGCSDFSSTDSGFAQLLQPAKPTAIKASDGKWSNRIRVSSFNVNSATSYKIYRSTVSGSHGSIVETTASTFWDDTSVTPGTTYYYRVQACSEAGCSSMSSYDTGYAKSRDAIIQQPVPKTTRPTLEKSERKIRVPDASR